MRNRRALRALILSACFVAACCWGYAASADGDSKAIRDVVARYVRARNEKDPQAVRQLFTPDADQLVSSGEWRKGLDELIRGTTSSSQKELPKSSITVESVRFIDTHAAIVDGRYQTTSTTGAVRNMWTTLVVKRTNGDWKITAIRNMLPAPPGGAH